MLILSTLKGQSPKVVGDLKVWLKGKVPMEDAQLNQLLEMAISSSPRTLLYDYFDEKGYFVSIYNSNNSNDSIRYTIQGPFSWLGEDSYKNRREAEEAAWLRCFQLLEEKL